MLIELKIGGYRIRLHEAEGRPLLSWPLWTFDLFHSDEDKAPDIRLEVRVTDRLPDLPHGRLRFDACQGLWQLYEYNSGYVLETLKTNDQTLYSRSIIDRDYSQVEVWVRGEQEGVGWTPTTILNPIMELCLTSKLAMEGGLLLHAAGLLTKHGAWVFTGPSGAGKSTLSNFFAARGGCVLNDERIIIRKVNGEFFVYGTPWPGTGQIANAQEGILEFIYCIRHGSRTHIARPLCPQETVPQCLQQCFLPHWDRVALDRTVATIGELIERTPCFDLAFLDMPDVVDYLHEHAVYSGRPQRPVLL